MGLILFCAAFLLTITGGGKALLVMLNHLPVIGSWISWWLAHIGLPDDGYLANFTHAGLSLMIMTFLLAPFFYGSTFMKKTIFLCGFIWEKAKSTL